MQSSSVGNGRWSEFPPGVSGRLRIGCIATQPALTWACIARHRMELNFVLMMFVVPLYTMCSLVERFLYNKTKKE